MAGLLGYSVCGQQWWYDNDMIKFFKESSLPFSAVFDLDLESLEMP